MPWQFWDMTIREFMLQVDGYRSRQEAENERIAHLLSAFLNPVGVVQIDPKKVKRSKTITADDILGRKKPKARSPDQHKSILDGLVARTKDFAKQHQTERKR